MNLCILIPLIVGLLSALLGYLLGKITAKGNDNSSEIDFWRNKNAQLEKDLAACRDLKLPENSASFGAGSTGTAAGFVAGNASEKSVSTGASTSGTQAAAGFVADTVNAESVSSGLVFQAGAAKAAFGKAIKENDLKVIEGIGPKIAELFNDKGIHTWAELANTGVSTLQSHLDTKGQRYRVHNPGTWPMQSGLAAEGKWTALKKWQDENDYGKAK